MKKTPIIVIAVLIIAGAAFFYFMGDKIPTGQDTLVADKNPEAEAAAARVLALLKLIDDLKIDTSLFSNPAYQTLRDYEVAIPPQEVGRPNPFSPLPGQVTVPKVTSPRR